MLPPWSAAFLAGFFVQLFSAGCHRVIQASFPLNMVGVFLLCYLLLGIPLGALWQGRKGALSVRGEGILLFLIGLFLLASVLNKDVSIHYFLGNLYYKYPAPPHAWLHTAAQALSILLCFAPVFLLSVRFSETFPRPRDGLRTYALYVAGLLLGGAASYFCVLAMGGHLTLALACAGCLPFFRFRRWTLAGLVVVAALAAAAFLARPVPFLWQVRQYHLLESRWTPYYRLQFVAFQDDRCMGGVYNNVMLWYTCDDPALLPTPLASIHRAAARNNHRILVAGRAEGTCPMLVHKAWPEGKKITSVEYDPVVADRVNGRYAPFSNGIFLGPDREALSADLRQWIRRSGERFDMIYLNGIGNRLYTLPLSFIFQEDYLLSREAMEDLFENRLTDKGLLLLDWGSTREKEAFMFMANIPEGVHVRILWQALAEYPMMGMPLFFIFASRDPGTVDAVVDELKQGHLGWREIPIDESLAPYRYTDDKPFLQKDLAVFLLIASLPLLGLLLAISNYGLKQARARFQGLPALPLYLLGTGFLFAFLQAIVLSRHARLFLSGAPQGALWLSSALLLGFLAPHLFFRGLPVAARRALVLASPVALAALLSATALFQQPAVLTLAALAGGFFCATFWAAGLGRTAREHRGTAYGLHALGIVWGIWMFQGWVGIGGYAKTMVFFCAAALALAWLYRQGIGRRGRPAPEEEEAGGPLPDAGPGPA